MPPAPCFLIEPLDPARHRREAFDWGVEALNDDLATRARIGRPADGRRPGAGGGGRARGVLLGPRRRTQIKGWIEWGQEEGK